MRTSFEEFEERRVVIYARVSTEHEAQISALGNQIDWYNIYLDHHPEWKLVDKYIDEGITGTSAEKRPEFMRMLNDAKDDKFDLIITREVSRFARNTVDTLQYTRKLKTLGVEVFFINDGIKTFDGDGELRLSLMASLAQDESRKTSVRVKSGQQISMNNGVFYGNGNILGYDKVGKDLVINPEQAQTVRMIYDMYLAGDGLTKIKAELERRGRKTSMGHQNWHCTVISHVLRNTFYCGIITYHKEYVPDYLTQKKVKNYGEMELTQVQGTHKPIVTVEEFDRVQRIMDSRRGECKNLKTGRRCKGKTPPKSIWSKLLLCSCGHRYNRVKWSGSGENTRFGYQCYHVINNGSYESRKKRGLPLDDVCRSTTIPEWKLEMMAKYIFNNFLSDKSRVLELANSMLKAHITDTKDKPDNSALIAQKQDELEKLNQKFDRYVDMRSEDEITKEVFKAKTEELQKQITAVQNLLSELVPAEEETVVDDYEEKITVLKYALEKYTDFDDGGDIPHSVIEAFVKKIVVTPDGFDWYLRFGGDDPINCKIEGKRAQKHQISADRGTTPPSALEQYRQLLRTNS